MDASFWLARWQNNELGFQLDAAHPLLQQCLPSLLEGCCKVLIPLCGKSPDIAYISGFFPVLGIELSAIACHDFFIEQRLGFYSCLAEPFRCYQSGNITLWQGDFFAFEPAHSGDCNVVYDRAALIALPPAMRRQYAAKLMQLVPAGARILLLSLEYPQHEKQGPPFAVYQQEIEQLFPAANITLLAERDITGNGFARRRFDTSSLIEKAYCITLP